MIKSSILAAINWYQKRGGSHHFFNIDCNFEPSCSEYTKQAVEKYGVFKGINLGLSRIKRCNNPDCINKIHDPLQ